MSKKYDAVIIGGGHNGLVCAALAGPHPLMAAWKTRASFVMLDA